MTDKEKIRAELERQKKENNGSPLSVCNDLLSFIDSMQEEPSPVWHDVSEEPDEQRELLCEWDSVDAAWHEVAFYHADTQDYWNYTSKVEGVTKWAYIDDLLSIKEEEPVSEDLEEEINNYLKVSFAVRFPTLDIESIKADVRYIARRFANWQKEQMMKDAISGAFIRRNKYTKQNVLNGFSVTCEQIQKFNNGDKVKVIIIKE